MGLAWAASAGPEALLLLLQDVISFQKFSHAIIYHRGNQFVYGAHTAYQALIAQIGGWSFFKEQLHYSQFPVCRKHPAKEYFIDQGLKMIQHP